jgi:hypothetical protein
LQAFAAEAREVLCEVDADIRRTEEWLEQQLHAWKDEVRRCEDEVFQAKQELARRRMMKVGDRPLDTTEQEKALLLARRRLEYAEEQVERTQKWLRDLPHAVTDYRGRGRQLSAFVEADLPRACALLERKLASLAAYLAVEAAPRQPDGVGMTPAPPAEKKEQP